MIKKTFLFYSIFIVYLFAIDKTSTFDVKGMMCGGGCVKKINRAMDSIEGIKSREVNFEKSLMVVTYDNKLVNDELIISALEKNNYSCAVVDKTKKKSMLRTLFDNLKNN